MKSVAIGKYKAGKVCDKNVIPEYKEFCPKCGRAVNNLKTHILRHKL